MNIPLLSLIIWLPIGSLLILLFIPQGLRKTYPIIALVTTILQGIGVLFILKKFTASLGFQLIEELVWMRLPLGNLGTLSIKYAVGVDGMNIGLLGLVVFILMIAVIASWPVNKYTQGYFALFLLLDTLIIGSFVAIDFLLFYLFFEATLIPIYFFIGLWGGRQRAQAATKFFLYTLLGTICILVVLIGLGLSVYSPLETGIQAGILDIGDTITSEQLASIQHMVQNHQIALKDMVHALDLRLMHEAHNFIPGSMLGLEAGQCLWGQPIRLLAFVGLLVGFLIKLAAVPLHSWLPEAHVEAPTPISIILSAILLKIGGYGILRTAYSIFPEGALYYSFWIAVLGVVSIGYAALNALAMQDLKRMIAYASIAHMGYFLLGIASLTHAGIHGALYQLISHGLVTALLFLVISVLDDRTNNRNLENYSGLALIMPDYTAITMIAFLAALGLPGFSGFIAELLILLGALQATTFTPWIVLVGAIGIFLNAIYFIWTLQRVFWGKFSLRFPAWQVLLKDLSIREYSMFIPLIASILLLGIFPDLLLNLCKDAVSQLVTNIHTIGKEHLALIFR